MALIAALEPPCNAEVIVAAVSRFLGPGSRRASGIDHSIRQRGQIPVILFMVGDVDAVVATTTSVPPRTLH